MLWMRVKIVKLIVSVFNMMLAVEQIFLLLIFLAVQSLLPVVKKANPWINVYIGGGVALAVIIAGVVSFIYRKKISKYFAMKSKFSNILLIGYLMLMMVISFSLYLSLSV